jgi:hypothetical protein
MPNKRRVTGLIVTARWRGLRWTPWRQTGFCKSDENAAAYGEVVLVPRPWRLSTHVYFGPRAPAGMESNWVQTIPGKGWFIILRLYGPLESWFDKTWKPGEIELDLRPAVKA